ncbi:MAG: FtsW/RodA/SpoVE family cell cycle protein, partial [Lachnospiraceae bacterium]
MPRSKGKKHYDYSLLVIVFMLVIVGLIILYSTSAYNGQVKFQDSFYYLKKQAFATTLGMAGMFIVANIDYRIWRHFAVLAYIAAVLLSIAVIFVGDEYN